MPGADADVVLFDPDKRVTLSVDMLHENVDFTPYEGFQLDGYPVMTILRGMPLVKEGEYIGGMNGEYLKCGLPELIQVS